MDQTRDGHACRRWDDLSDVPGTGRPQRYGADYGVDNHCRNPDYDSGGVWCYTNDPVDWWQYCDVPACADDVEEPVDEPVDEPVSGKLGSFEAKM